MKVLIIGAGGREHALAWRCAKSSRVEEVLVAPGNAGTAGEAGVRNVDIAADDIDALLRMATRERVDLTIVGPEQPLVAGISDRFRDAGLACFGPGAAASQLEGSKAFSKAFLQRHGISTAAFREFSDFDAARAYIESREPPLVIKADGLAAGKGVIIAHSTEAAIAAASDMLVDGRFGDASRSIVIEDFLRGEEASFIAITDGNTILPLATSQDHKARDNGDNGPNTGGMGAYSPAPVVTASVAEHVMRDIMQPTIDGLRNDGIDYCGFLYAGLMIDGDGKASVLEFNCRLGDPETQPILMRLNSDLPTLCELAIAGQLAEADIAWDTRAALGVVLAAEGYPGSYRRGDVIEGLAHDDPDVKIFHAGTAMRDGQVVSNGGRVLCVTALGATVGKAAERAYAVARQVRWTGRFLRDDIGRRAIEREH